MEGPLAASIGTPLLWGAFAAVVTVSLTLDLFVFHRRAHAVRFREAVGWSAFWIGLSLTFNLWIHFEAGGGPALEFLTGYVIEKALSVDNIFVFVVLFNYFAVPDRYQHRVLYWGVLGAILLRGAFVVLGAVLLAKLQWILYVFGAFLVLTGGRLIRQRETEVHPERNPIARLGRRYLPVTEGYRGQRFLVAEGGRWLATPLLLVLLVVESTDVIFAVDSIPAIFAVTRDPFLVFTSNIFAILGLRALYFVLADLIDRFRYLKVGLGLVLIFVGAKMLLDRWLEIPIGLSLGVVSALLTGAMVVSWLLSRDTQVSRGDGSTG